MPRIIVSARPSDILVRYYPWERVWNLLQHIVGGCRRLTCCHCYNAQTRWLSLNGNNEEVHK